MTKERFKQIREQAYARIAERERAMLITESIKDLIPLPPTSPFMKALTEAKTRSAV